MQAAPLLRGWYGTPGLAQGQGDGDKFPQKLVAQVLLLQGSVGGNGNGNGRRVPTGAQ